MWMYIIITLIKFGKIDKIKQEYAKLFPVKCMLF